MNQQIEKQYTLNFFDPACNSNKVWIGTAYTNGTFEARYGRVRDGANLALTTKSFSSPSAAVSELERKYNEKLRKGYRETATIKDGETVQTKQSPVDLSAVALVESSFNSEKRSDYSAVERCALHRQNVRQRRVFIFAIKQGFKLRDGFLESFRQLEPENFHVFVRRRAGQNL